MRQTNVRRTAWAVAMLIVMSGAIHEACAQTSATPYPTMAPLDQYLIRDADSEIAFARSAAPPSISDSAEVLVLGRNGYTVAVKGTNGFVCLVERSWVMTTSNPEFWNPKIRSPNCWNAAAAKTFVPFDLLRTNLVLAGKSKAEIAQAIATAFDQNELPAVTLGGMCYMMSKQQYLNDRSKQWHPHLMFYLPGDVDLSWGANLPGSPVIAVNNPEARATVFMVVVGAWSDGTAAPAAAH
jgi:hypothetical protein